MPQSLPPDVHEKVLTQFKSRANAQGACIGSDVYLAMQGEFLVGAMATMTVLGYTASEVMRPAWVINIMQGGVIE